MSKQRGGERAVPALAVERDVVGLSGERDEEAGEFSDTRESGGRQREPAMGERIVAAGVEKNKMASLSLAELGQHGVERHRPGFDVAERMQLRADGNEIVAAAELKAVTGVVKQRHVRLDRLSRELVDRALHADEVEIGLDRDLEPQRLQGRGDVGGVVGRIGERGDARVGAVADDKGDAVLGARRDGGDRKREHADQRRKGVGAESDAPLKPWCPARQLRTPEVELQGREEGVLSACGIFAVSTRWHKKDGEVQVKALPDISDAQIIIVVDGRRHLFGALSCLRRSGL